MVMGILCFGKGNTGRQSRKITFSPSKDGENTVRKLPPETGNSASGE